MANQQQAKPKSTIEPVTKLHSAAAEALQAPTLESAVSREAPFSELQKGVEGGSEMDQKRHSQGPISLGLYVSDRYKEGD